MNKNLFKENCRYFSGEKPCKFKGLCEKCPQFSPVGKRILILKLAAPGDVLRTTSLLRGLKKKYPDAFITWVVEERAIPVLKGNQLIDRIVPIGLEAFACAHVERFDLVISLDKDPRSAAIANFVEGEEKRGFYFTSQGIIDYFDAATAYSYRLGLDDELKFKQNKKTYQEMVFETAGLDYQREEYVFILNEEEKSFGEKFKKNNKILENELFLGFNTGGGGMFANKGWTINGFVKLAHLLKENFQVKLILLGGPEEREKNRKIMLEADELFIDSGCENSIREFASIINVCHLVVSGDTLAMHLAIALKKPVVALFGSTCPQEVDLYNRGAKIISPIDCSPCYKNFCDKTPNCMEMIKPEKVYQVIKTWLDK